MPKSLFAITISGFISRKSPLPGVDCEDSPPIAATYKTADFFLIHPSNLAPSATVFSLSIIRRNGRPDAKSVINNSGLNKLEIIENSKSHRKIQTALSL
ncbi:MAG: hypothetical protein ACPMAG_11550 [Limisphaerales bacterium]